MPSDFRQATRAVSEAVDAVTALLSGGALRIYDGPRPASADESPPARSILLVECGFATPAFHSALDGAATARPISSARATANGSPTWFRTITPDGLSVFDGAVGLEGSRADLELPVATIIAGAEVAITSLTYTLPRA